MREKELRSRLAHAGSTDYAPGPHTPLLGGQGCHQDDQCKTSAPTRAIHRLPPTPAQLARHEIAVVHASLQALGLDSEAQWVALARRALLAIRRLVPHREGAAEASSEGGPEGGETGEGAGSAVPQAAAKGEGGTGEPARRHGRRAKFKHKQHSSALKLAALLAESGGGGGGGGGGGSGGGCGGGALRRRRIRWISRSARKPFC